jgi:hypothetical protein
VFSEGTQDEVASILDTMKTESDPIQEFENVPKVKVKFAVELGMPQLANFAPG